MRSYAAEREGALVLIDPMSPPRSLVAGRELRVALTCSCHARTAPVLGVREIAVPARPAFYLYERVLWLAEHGALVFGDSFPSGPVPDDWVPEGQTRADYRAWLLPLLALPSSSSYPRAATPEGVTCSSERLPGRARTSRLTAMTLI